MLNLTCLPQAFAQNQPTTLTDGTAFDWNNKTQQWYTVSFPYGEMRFMKPPSPETEKRYIDILTSQNLKISATLGWPVRTDLRFYFLNDETESTHLGYPWGNQFWSRSRAGYIYAVGNEDQWLPFSIAHELAHEYTTYGYLATTRTFTFFSFAIPKWIEIAAVAEYIPQFDLQTKLYIKQILDLETQKAFQFLETHNVSELFNENDFINMNVADPGLTPGSLLAAAVFQLSIEKNGMADTILKWHLLMNETDPEKIKTILDISDEEADQFARNYIKSNTDLILKAAALP